MDSMRKEEDEDEALDPVVALGPSGKEVASVSLRASVPAVGQRDPRARAAHRLALKAVTSAALICP